MNFIEVGMNIFFYQFDGFFYCCICIFLLLVVWFQMIVVENNVFVCKFNFIGNCENKFVKVCWCYFGIIVKLIDLV